MTKRDARGRDHVVRFTRPSGSVFAYWKRSKTGAGEGLGTRLLELVWDVYLTNFMFRRRQTRTEYKKKDARVEIRVKVDGCRALEAV